MARFIAPKNCTVCKRKFRPKSTKLTDFPGTILHSKQGMCHRCFSNNGVLVESTWRLSTDPMPEDCIDCHKPMRPSKTPKRDQPNTVLHRAGGRCTVCYKAQRDAKRIPADAGTPDPQIMSGYNRFIEARRQREQRERRLAKVRMVTR